MKGAFSRLTRRGGSPRFDSVRLQQGRVLLDADWNDQVEISEHELRERTRMIIGEAGGPELGAGFEIHAQCGVVLNAGGSGQHYGQWIEVEANPTLPFASGEYTIALGFILPKRDKCDDPDSTLLLSVAGQWSVRVEGGSKVEAGCLTLDTGTATVALGTVTYDTPWLLVVSAWRDPKQGDHELDLWSYAAEQEPARAGATRQPFQLGQASSGAAVCVGGARRETTDLDCTITGLWIWTRASSKGEGADGLPVRERDGELKLHGCELVCKLDMSNIRAREPGPGAQINDASGHENYGLIESVSDAQALPPVILLEAYARAGVYFVAGLMAHSAEIRPVSLTGVGAAESRLYQFYLEVSRRFITALRDPNLLEPALGDPGPDTTGRTLIEAVARVVWDDEDDKGLEQRWRAVTRRADIHARGQAHFCREPGAGGAGNRMYRVEIHNPGWIQPAGTAFPESWRRAASPAQLRKSNRVVVEDPQIAAMLSLDSLVAVWAKPVGKTPPKVHYTRIKCVEKGGSFELAEPIPLPPASDEDAKPKPERAQVELIPIATYKWSRDNGCVAFPVDKFCLPKPSKPAKEGSADASASPKWTILLDGPGFNGLDIERGQWLEFSNVELDTQGGSGWFFLVEDIDFSFQLSISATLVGSEAQWHQWLEAQAAAAGEVPAKITSKAKKRCWTELGSFPIVRCWDVEYPRKLVQRGTKPEQQELPLVIQPVIEGEHLLELGLEVGFSGEGFLDRGDWWVTPVRDAVDAGLLSGTHPHPPQGIERYVAKLGSLELGPGTSTFHDQRELFAPLTKLARRPEPSADGSKTDATPKPKPESKPTEPASKPEPKPAPVQPSDAARIAQMQDWFEHGELLVPLASKPAGLVDTQQRVRVEIPPTASQWQREQAPGQPSGPGVAVSWRGRPVFVGAKGVHEYSDGSWHALPALPEALTHAADFVVAVAGPLLWVLGAGAGADAPGAYSLFRSGGPWEKLGRLNPHKLPDAMQPGFGAVNNAMVSLEGALHLVGGRVPSRSRNKPSSVLASHIQIDPRSGHVVIRDPLETARAELALVAHEGQLLAIGGTDEAGKALASVELWSPWTNTWTEIWNASKAAPGDPGALALCSAVSTPAGVVVSGGHGGQETAMSEQTWLFEPDHAKWTALAPLASGRSQHGSVVYDDAVWAIAGDRSASLDRLALARTMKLMKPERQAREHE